MGLSDLKTSAMESPLGCFRSDCQATDHAWGEIAKRKENQRDKDLYTNTEINETVQEGRTSIVGMGVRQIGAAL